jgi:hypothetical protein
MSRASFSVWTPASVEAAPRCAPLRFALGSRYAQQCGQCRRPVLWSAGVFARPCIAGRRSSGLSSGAASRRLLASRSTLR